MNRRDLFRLPLAQVEALSGREGAPLPPPPPAPPPPATVLGCGPHEFTESPLREWTLLGAMRGRWPVLWVHVPATDHAPTLEGLRGVLGFPPAVADRLLDPHARAGVEAIGGHLLALAPFGAGEGGALGRAAVLVGDDHLVTFEAGGGDRFGVLREGLRSPYARLRGGGSGAVALAALEPLLGALADAAAAYARRVDEVATAVADAPSPGTLARVHALRRELRAVERAVHAVPASLRGVAERPAPLPDDAGPRLGALAERCDAALESVGAARESAAALGEATLAGMQHRLEARLRTLAVAAWALLAVLVVAGGWLLLG